MSGGLGFALLSAIAAIFYGIFSIKWIVGKPAGNEKMRGMPPPSRKALPLT